VSRPGGGIPSAGFTLPENARAAATVRRGPFVRSACAASSPAAASSASSASSAEPSPATPAAASSASSSAGPAPPARAPAGDLAGDLAAHLAGDLADVDDAGDVAAHPAFPESFEHSRRSPATSAGAAEPPGCRNDGRGDNHPR
jgi:hypothetical protein